MTQVTDHDEAMATSLELIAAHVKWMRSRYSDNTTRDAERFLRRLDRELPYGLPCSLFDELEDWLGHDPAWSAQTRETYRLHIVRFFKWATRPQAPRITLNPALGLERYEVPPGLPRPATDAQVEWCVTQAVLPWRVFCTLTAYAGARPCEVADIAQAPHDYITEHTTRIVHGKGGRSRILKTHAMLWEAIRYLEPGPLATRRGGRPVDADWVSKRTATYLHRAGQAFTLYNLRHWYGTTLQIEKGDSRVTQEALGHASLTSTQIYTKVSLERIGEAIDRLPSFTRR